MKKQKAHFGGPQYEKDAMERIASGPKVGGQWKRCPKCGTSDTVCRHTDGEVEHGLYVCQHRKCRNPSCKHSFKAYRPN